MLLAFFAALLSAIVFMVDRVAARGNVQQATIQLGAGARTGTEVLRAMRAELTGEADRLAATPAVQRAVVAGDRAPLRKVLRGRDATIRVRGTVIGALRPPSLVSTASIASSRGRLLASVTVGLPLDETLLARIRDQITLPVDARLLLLRHGRVVAGGPRGALAGGDRVVLGGISYVAQLADLRIGGLSLAAIEPSAGISARSKAFRRRTALAALLTLLVAAALAVPLARPLARKFAELSDGAERDPLTGLANRRTFDARLSEELDRARRYGNHVALVLADVDDFKRVNDRYGHQVGDDVLGAFAAAVSGCLRELDLAARFGGEEFAVVLPGAHTEDARRIAEQMRLAVGELQLAGPAGEPIRVTASFGAADFPSCATGAELVGCADDCLYEAKRLGKDRVVGAIG